MTKVIGAVALVSLIIASAFFASSETAMMCLNRYRLRHMAKTGNKTAARICRMLERPDRLLGGVLLGNTFANSMAASLVTWMGVHYFGDVAVVIGPTVLTIVLLIFAEVAPKTVGALYPERLAFPFSLALQTILRVFYPLVWFVNGISNGLLELFGIRVKKHKNEVVTKEELRAVVSEAKAVMNTNHSDMLLRILDMECLTVDDVIIPKNEIYGVDLEADWPDIIKTIVESPYAWLPVYQGSIDHVQGMLSLRRALYLLAEESLTMSSLTKTTDSVYFIPEGTPLGIQLTNFRKEKRRVGLVVDEYGDIQGLVTLLDVLEEIVGEFTTTLPTDPEEVVEQRDGTYLVEGSINVRELNRRMDWEFPEDGPKTLSGLIVEQLEAMPVSGIAMRIAGIPVEILSVQDNMVKTTRVSPGLKLDPVPDEK